MFNSINFIVGTWPTDALEVRPLKRRTALNRLNATVMGTGIGAFLCPTDAGAFSHIGNNYRGNTGVGPYWGTNAEYPDSGNGIFPEIGPIRMSQVPDGLSHTAAFSERLRGSGNVGRLDPQRDVYRVTAIFFTADNLLQACLIAARPANQRGNPLSGNTWFWTGRQDTLYNHAQGPNGKIPDCANGGSLPQDDMATARSAHYGGANALMGDGSGRFVSEFISLPVWRALGTRNGGELVD